METFYAFWNDLGVWVHGMLIECPEEQLDPAWFNWWLDYDKFSCDDPAISQQLVKVCIMKNICDNVTIVNLLEQLTLQIPYIYIKPYVF